jgi:hypothetical protein
VLLSQGLALDEGDVIIMAHGCLFRCLTRWSAVSGAFDAVRETIYGSARVPSASLTRDGISTSVPWWCMVYV